MENRALQVPPAVEKLLHISEVPHLPFLHYHLHQIVLEAPASVLHGLIPDPGRATLKVGSGPDVGRGERRWEEQALLLLSAQLGEAHELPDLVLIFHLLLLPSNTSLEP